MFRPARPMLTRVPRRAPVAAIAVLGAVTLVAVPAFTQEGDKNVLPLKDVVLFSSGVGYFQRSGKIEGNAVVPLSFRAEQVNDILKSLVLLDPNGSVRPVTYAAAEPISRRLGSAGKALDQSITLGSLLRNFQGARVRLETGALPVEGRIVSVSLKAIPTERSGFIQEEVLNVLTATGLRAIRLDQITEVRLLDEKLDKELRESLELLAAGSDESRRSVELHFAGNAARTVQAGYLQEMPVWKSTYRLVLDDKEKPYLQGWALIENTTDEDWKEVKLSLISGRPISFIQDLYQPLYVPRPVVQAQVIGSPNPQTYGEVIELAEGVRAADAAAGGAMGGGSGLFGGGARRDNVAGVPGPPGITGGVALGARMRSGVSEDKLEERRKMAMSAAQLADSVSSQAQGTERGDLFEYAIKTPVTLARGRAAMVPVVSEAVHVDAVSIFDADSDSKHALNGMRLRNSTTLHLAGGPITIFKDGGYAGDAQIGNLQPGEDRLLSYAVDLELVADRKEPKFTQATTSITAKSGVLVITRKEQRERTYSFRNKSAQAKAVLIQQNQEDGFKLAEPAMPLEKTPEEYRFKVTVPASQTSELKVVTERPLSQQIAIMEADFNLIVAYSQNAQTPEKLRASLKEFVIRKRKITDLQAQIAARQAEIKGIDEEQARIRQNMAQLDRNSALYQQYVKKLTDQESRIEKVREELAKLMEERTAAEKELRAFADTVTD